MAETARPLLRFVEQPVDQAIAKMWLSRSWGHSAPDGSWSGLAYQTMQTQGAQQSISTGYGFLSTQWVDAVEQRAGRAVLRQWSSLLGNTERIHTNTDYLTDCLLNHQESAWLAHLRDIAYRMSQQLLSSTPLYTVHEVKEITNLMTLSVTSPLRSILEREQGTKRFGHALRLLGQRNASALRDLIDLLDCVRDQAALIRVLARAAQECAVVAARTDFIIVPNDDDLAFLLDDVTQYGVQTVATLIIILSALRYPAVKDNNNPVAEVEQAGEAARDESELPLNTSFSAELNEN